MVKIEPIYEPTHSRGMNHVPNQESIGTQGDNCRLFWVPQIPKVNVVFSVTL